MNEITNYSREDIRQHDRRSCNLLEMEQFFAYSLINSTTFQFFLSRFGDLESYVFFSIFLPPIWMVLFVCKNCVQVKKVEKTPYSMLNSKTCSHRSCILLCACVFVHSNNFLWHRLIDKSKSKFVSDTKFHWYFCFVQFLFCYSHILDFRQNNKFVWIYTLITLMKSQKKNTHDKELTMWNHKCLSNYLISNLLFLPWLASSESVLFDTMIMSVLFSIHLFWRVNL